jgi:hypothetical protein
MESIAGIRSALPTTPQAAGRTSATAAGPDRPGAQALLPVLPITLGDAHSRGSNRPAAPFLAHLIATEAQLPQTRARRRAKPDAAAAIYATAGRARGGSIGTICARDI